MGPKGPRGLGPIKQNCLKKPFSSGLQVSKRHFGILDVKNLFVSPCRFPNDILGFQTSKSSKTSIFDYVRNKAMLVLVF